MYSYDRCIYASMCIMYYIDYIRPPDPIRILIPALAPNPTALNATFDIYLC